MSANLYAQSRGRVPRTGAQAAACAHPGDASNGRVTLHHLLWGRLEFGHSGSDNPKGCQRVVRGRWGTRGWRPPGNGAGDVRHLGRGARRVSGPRTAARSVARCSRLWHPSGVLGPATRFSGGRSGQGGADHRLPSGNPPGWPPFRSAGRPNSSLLLWGRGGPSLFPMLAFAATFQRVAAPTYLACRLRTTTSCL